MKYLEDISLLTTTLLRSQTFHALVIYSPPGWAKSTTVERVLSEGAVSYRAFGAYSTALALYNALAQWPQDLHVIDDCAGVFGNQIAMSILKAATWASVGSGGERRIAWGSTSEKVSQPEFLFRGKVVLLTNSLPSAKETEAFLSRALTLRIRLSETEMREALLQAATDPRFFPDQKRAQAVASFLTNRIHSIGLGKVSLRTLHLGYELAGSSPEKWKEIFEKLIPGTISPRKLVQELHGTGAEVQLQLQSFREATGLSERTFFNYRGDLGVSRLWGGSRKSRKLHIADSRSHGNDSGRRKPIRRGELEKHAGPD